MFSPLKPETMDNKNNESPNSSSTNNVPLSSDIIGTNDPLNPSIKDTLLDNVLNANNSGWIGSNPGNGIIEILGDILSGDNIMPNDLSSPQPVLSSRLVNDLASDIANSSNDISKLITINEKGVPGKPIDVLMGFYNHKFNSITAEIEALQSIKNTINVNFVNREDYNKLVIQIQQLEEEKSALIDTVKSLGKTIDILSIHNKNEGYEEKRGSALKELADIKLSLKKILGTANYKSFFNEINKYVHVLAPIYNTFIVLNARYSTLQEEKNEGTISNNDYTLQINKIVLSLVNKIDEIMESDLIKT